MNTNYYKIDTLELSHSIEEDTVRPIIQALNSYQSCGDEIRIQIPYNEGGDVGLAIELAEAIENTKASVFLQLGNYVVSAAAYVVLRSYLSDKEHITVEAIRRNDDECKCNPVIIYHRPRFNRQGHVVFSSSMDVDKEPAYDTLKAYTEDFDFIFDEFMSLLEEVIVTEHAQNGYPTAIQNAKNAYYDNYDFFTTIVC
ncbi:hypothetical protein [Vibrio sp. 2-1(7)]|jgi:hypothetical protein|uniref:hypothetical protein n=1 Tax=Vibrio sp. 2-1(7) TaxID=2591011 RepID=UPI001482F345|nr:hypothetical protein [Vibrio sp. 2-1(7)]NNN64427.1 hypothetical protein [Vibrio sp. 2-1(7)]